MFNTSDSVPRADISTVLMEAVGQEGLYIGQEVFPVYPSPTIVGRYPKFVKQSGELLSASAGFTKRNATGTYNEDDRKFEWDTFQTEEFGQKERVDDTVVKQMENFFDAEMVAAKMAMNRMMLDYELLCAATLMNASNFTATAAAVNYTESLIATVDFPRDMNAAIERATILGEPPDTLVMSLQLFNFIRRTPKMQTYVYGFLNVTQGGSQITSDMMAAAFGIPRILIAKKSYNSALKGKTNTLLPVWGNAYIAVMKTGQGDFMNGGCGRTIVWDADSPGGLFTSESYRDEERRSNIVRVRSHRSIKVTVADSVQLITTNFSTS